MGRSSFLLCLKGWPVLNYSSIYDYLSQGFEICSVEKTLNKFKSPSMVHNLTGSQKAAFVAQLLRKHRPALILTYSEEQAQKWTNDLRTWLPGEKIFMFPTTEWLPFEVLGRSKETTAERIRIFKGLARDNSCTIVASVLAVERRLFSPESWRQHCLEFKVGLTYSIPEILRNLLTIGYERVHLVEGKGQFALRGGILDIAPLDSEPVRLEFFDDQIDSIRNFDFESQKSVTVLEDVLIIPVMEYVLTSDHLQQLSREIQVQSRRAIGRLQRSGRLAEADRLRGKIENVKDRLDQEIIDENIYPYLGLVQTGFVDFFSYLSVSVLLFWMSLTLKRTIGFSGRERLEEFTRQLEQGEAFVNPANQFITYEHVLNYGKRIICLAFNFVKGRPG